MKDKNAGLFDILIYLFVTVIFVVILLLPPVKEFVVHCVEIGADKINIFVANHPYLSMIIAILFLLCMGFLSAICSNDFEKDVIIMKDNKCNAYNHTYKCDASSCEECDYRMQENHPVISVKNFVSTMYAPNRYTFYLNDEIVDLDTLYDNDSSLNGFEFEDSNVVRLYS